MQSFHLLLSTLTSILTDGGIMYFYQGFLCMKIHLTLAIKILL